MRRAGPPVGRRAHSNSTQHQFWRTTRPCSAPGATLHSPSSLCAGSQNGSMIASASLMGMMRMSGASRRGWSVSGFHPARRRCRAGPARCTIRPPRPLRQRSFACQVAFSTDPPAGAPGRQGDPSGQARPDPRGAAPARQGQGPDRGDQDAHREQHRLLHGAPGFRTARDRRREGRGRQAFRLRHRLGRTGGRGAGLLAPHPGLPHPPGGRAGREVLHPPRQALQEHQDLEARGHDQGRLVPGEPCPRQRSSQLRLRRRLQEPRPGMHGR